MTAHSQSTAPISLLFEPEAFVGMNARLDADARTVFLQYGYPGAATFQERIVFHGSSGLIPWYREHPDVVTALLGMLHVIAGVSYYKLCSPPYILFPQATAKGILPLANAVYDHGLREFRVTNHLSVDEPPGCDFTNIIVNPKITAKDHVFSPATLHKPVVMLGGGKDSMVAAEAIRSLNPTAMCINPHPLIRELATRAAMPLITVERVIDPQLALFNKQGGYNGHVPITAINMAIAAVGLMFYDYTDVVFAIEHSASEETTVVGDVLVNHQYSKSQSFEEVFASALTAILGERGRVFSILRPYSELQITGAFTRTPQYFETFCSCNRAFRTTAKPTDRWCGECDKCRFITLMLATYLSPDEIIGILGVNLLDVSSMIPDFQMLMSADKPFECVGERIESAYAFTVLAKNPKWKDHAVVRALAPRAKVLIDEATPTDLPTVVSSHLGDWQLIPEQFRSLVRRYMEPNHAAF